MGDVTEWVFPNYRMRWAQFRGKFRCQVPVCSTCGRQLWEKEGEMTGCPHHSTETLDVVDAMERGWAKGLMDGLLPEEES